MAETTETTEKLLLGFYTDANSKASLTVNDSSPEVDAEQVSAAMDAMIAQNVLQDSKGNLVTIADSAQRITTTKQILF